MSASSENWAEFAADVISKDIVDIICRRGTCNIMLTGGKAAERLYHQWASATSFPTENLTFFFGDERGVPSDNEYSNYALAMRTFLAKKKFPKNSIVRMEAERSDHENAAREYEGFLPEQVDILLLGMGLDGHIASIFPNSSALKSDSRSVLSLRCPAFPAERMTITPRVILNASSVYLLATGSEKGKILSDSLKSPTNYNELPVRLTIGRTWLLDAAAARQFDSGY
jgi:6-phosphogluconolactonase